jgi:hypothetical protein
MLLVCLLQHRQCGAKRQAQVGAGVTIRDRENIDLIKDFLLVDDAVNSRNERICQVVTGQMC